jgi:hypothetical protein
MSSLRDQLKRNKTVRGRRWTIRRNKENKLTEVKMIFDPHVYKTFKNSKKMYGDKALLKILNKEFKE